MLKATSKARKQNLGLTVPVATRQARKIVDAAMPGVNATVESRFGHDLDTDTPTVITTITFPETADASDVACWAERAPGAIRSTWASCSIVITRKR
jgi:hypothetical protein